MIFNYDLIALYIIFILLLTVVTAGVVQVNEYCFLTTIVFRIILYFLLITRIKSFYIFIVKMMNIQYLYLYKNIEPASTDEICFQLRPCFYYVYQLCELYESITLKFRNIDILYTFIICTYYLLLILILIYLNWILVTNCRLQFRR